MVFRSLRTCRLLRLSAHDCVQLAENAVFIEQHGIFVGHDHIQLSGVDEQMSEDFQAFLHKILLTVVDAGKKCVFPRSGLKTEFVEQFSHEACPAFPAVIVGRAALEAPGRC